MVDLASSVSLKGKRVVVIDFELLESKKVRFYGFHGWAVNNMKELLRKWVLEENVMVFVYRESRSFLASFFTVVYMKVLGEEIFLLKAVRNPTEILNLAKKGGLEVYGYSRLPVYTKTVFRRSEK